MGRTNSTNVIKFCSNSLEGGENCKKPHPIDLRLRELGRSRKWLACQVGKSEQCIREYCTRKLVLRPNALLTQRICTALDIDLNYIFLGPRFSRTESLGKK